MKSVSKQVIQLIAIAGLLAGPACAMAQDSQAAAADTTSKAQKQANFIEEEIRRTNEQLAEYDRLERLNRAGAAHPA